MLFTTIQELRRCFPAHAIDSIDPFVGVLDNSEHDFLLEKLGTPLYNRLCQYYERAFPSDVETESTSYFNRLLLLCQRAVAYDAMSRAIGMHIISVNNAGVNIPTADDYGKVDLDAVKTFKTTCIQEAHAAINRLLQTLEEWCKLLSESSGSDAASSSSSSDSSDSELETIVALWRQSRFFYLVATLLIPSAQVLQAYWNIYDSREKFIQMLPDLHYIQEEIIAPSIGEEFCAAICTVCPDTPPSTPTADIGRRPLYFIIHRLRKVLAVMLEERTSVINTDKLRRQTAHDEAVRMLQAAIEYIQNNSATLADADAVGTTIAEAFILSPLYIKPETETTAPPECPKFANNRSNSAMFVTPALN